MSLLAVLEQERAELELELLIREARHRQRRRRIRLASSAVSSLVIAGLAIGAVTHLLSAATHNRAGRPAVMSGAACSASPATFVSNAVFDATVIGTGSVRLGVGNDYVKTGARVVLYHRTTRSWAGIEAIWWLRDPDVRGPITVRGIALGNQGPIEVQPSDGGLAPGSGPFELPSNFQPVPDASAYPAVYPGSIWVRTAGCYAVDLSARGFNERIVFDVLMRHE